MISFLGAPVDLGQFAILLDVDGTLLDLAPTPREVFVSPQLRRVLQRLLERTGGALALVSGRPIEELDLLFAPLLLPIAGGHGAEIRLTPTGKVDRGKARPLPAALKRQLATIAAHGPGIILEDKEYSLAIHYRLAPEKEQTIRQAILAICEGQQAQVEILPGKAVFEIKSAGFDKGTAVRRLMGHKPFKARRPIFIGDDTTDEAALAVMPEFDGIGISVGRRIPGVSLCFDTPGEVRAWLEQVSQAEAIAAQ
ncbi:MAG TPA: trehalose-phosphatase [Xanthobacteraceae bacterium]|nr:trehalose-phosphatase [Xanthobacteraceae bacterium]